MRALKVLFIGFFLFCGFHVNAQLTFPTPTVLRTTDFNFTGFASGATTAYPSGMQGYQVQLTVDSSDSNLLYAVKTLSANSTSIFGGTIRNEVGTGISMGNNLSKRIGAIMVSTDATGTDSTRISFTARHILSRNNYAYRVLLAYRLGQTGSFTIATEEGSSAPIIYDLGLNTTTPDSNYVNLLMPSETWGQPEVQFLWLYYITAGNDAVAAARDRFELDEITISAPGARTTIVPDIQGDTLVRGTDTIRVTEILGATHYDFRILGNGAFGAINRVHRTIHPFVKLSWFAYSDGFQFNEPYDISVRPVFNTETGQYGDTFNIHTPVTVPNTELRTAFCNGNVATPSTNFLVDFVPFADMYEYVVTGTGIADSAVRFRGNQTNLASTAMALATFGGRPGGSYTVKVRAYSHGMVGSYSTICNLSIDNNVATVQLKPSWCDITISHPSKDRNQVLVSQTVPGASEYWAWVTDSADVVTIDSFVMPYNRYYFKIAQMPSFSATLDSIKPNSRYNVRTRARVPDGIGGFYEGVFGNSCYFITTDSADLRIGNFSGDPELYAFEKEVQVFPNPSDRGFFVEFEPQIESIRYLITVFDSKGSAIFQDEVSNPEKYYLEPFNDSGLYYLIIQSDKGAVIRKTLIQK